ncbi:hypothetical protein BU24DRAFT_404976 [Aaosphaeria arxii CBS 175.79]|uniref:MARVEL domain-containing protein n=1 Tax=Aaosphaeria arxii CBS 175.79 TaxID=1450172 RepID=A0A6A5Y8Y8_9PLEO|nr:uncharacterized protein BU24DRAFT_404976 [Aaosphaeria arxii CBS 175.79]KAF2022062.1 hypothetical protein BU24DRAFT_404976 [Aaosphaeria arxii CBS 175.79]
MSFSGFSFIFWRIMQIITLIPAMGMLAYFVDIYNTANQLTPRSLLIMFIILVLAVVWCVGTLFLYARAKHSANFVAFIDLLFVGALIGAVYEMRWVSDTDCASADRDGSYVADLGIARIDVNKYDFTLNKSCAMIKATWAFAIMNIIFFFITFLFALLVHRNFGSGDRVVVKRETHYSRHGHRSSHRSRSPRHSYSHSRRSYV